MASTIDKNNTPVNIAVLEHDDPPNIGVVAAARGATTTAGDVLPSPADQLASIVPADSWKQPLAGSRFADVCVHCSSTTRSSGTTRSSAETSTTGTPRGTLEQLPLPAADGGGGAVRFTPRVPDAAIAQHTLRRAPLRGVIRHFPRRGDQQALEAPE